MTDRSTMPRHRMPRLVLAGLLVSLLIHAGLLILVNRQPAPEPIEDHAGGGEPMTAQWIELDEAPAAEAAAPPRAERPDTTPPSPLSRPERHQTEPKPEPEPEPEPKPEPEPEPKPEPKPEPEPEPEPELEPEPETDARPDETTDRREAPDEAHPAPDAADSADENRDSAASSEAPGESSEPEQPPGFSAGYLDNPPPSYPRASMRLRQEGEVRLKVTVDAEGRPTDWSVETSSGHERLDRAAMQAVEKWRFEPATRGGKPVAGTVIVPMEFALQ